MAAKRSPATRPAPTPTPTPTPTAAKKLASTRRAPTPKRAATPAPARAPTAKRPASTRQSARVAPASTAPRRRIDRVTQAQRKQARLDARATYAALRAIHPDAHCELDHRDAFTLLVCTVLSAQTTDVLVNKVTPHLFADYPDAPTLASAHPGDVGRLLRERGLGMYNQKSKNIVGLAVGLMERHGGEVPRTLTELILLPGVGRKTANVVLGVAFASPEGVVVDTHVQRLSQRLGWTAHTEPPEIEKDLCRLFPREDWDMLSHTLIFHGRRVCFAQRPACAACGVSAACPSAFHAENIGRKPQRDRGPAPKPPPTRP